MLYKNLSNQKVYVYVSSNVTGQASTGQASNVTAKISKDGAAFSAATNSLVELEGGIYYLTLSQAETNSDAIAIIFTSTNAAVGAAPQIFYTSDTTAAVTLSSAGLDAINLDLPAGPASNFREQLNLLYQRFFGKSDINSSTGIRIYDTDDATVLTTQTVTDNGTTQTIGAAS